MQSMPVYDERVVESLRLGVVWIRQNALEVLETALRRSGIGEDDLARCLAEVEQTQLIGGPDRDPVELANATRRRVVEEAWKVALSSGETEDGGHRQVA
jgi:hypothetical protein